MRCGGCCHHRPVPTPPTANRPHFCPPSFLTSLCTGLQEAVMRYMHFSQPGSCSPDSWPAGRVLAALSTCAAPAEQPMPVSGLAAWSDSMQAAAPGALYGTSRPARP